MRVPVWAFNSKAKVLSVDFNVTVPSTLGAACSTGGKCAIQWYWYAIKNEQTYESCVDFYVTP